jgi:hypothetical protein
MTFAQLLAVRGFEVRHSRFHCPHCDGHARWTGSFSEAKQCGFCHRCKAKITVRSLTGLAFAPRNPGAARIRQAQFRKWLSEMMSEQSRREYRLHQRAKLAMATLEQYPDCEPAWAVLEEWHQAQRAFTRFWECASDRIGRFEVYKTWRAAYAGSITSDIRT